MTSTCTYLAVVPAYNEEGTVARVVSAIHERAPQFDVVVVDDGSTDATAEQAERAGAKVVRHPFNLGIGGAVQSGFACGLEHGYQRLVQIDGDGQHDPGELHKLTEAMDEDSGVDMVCGSPPPTPNKEQPPPHT